MQGYIGDHHCKFGHIERGDVKDRDTSPAVREVFPAAVREIDPDFLMGRAFLSPNPRGKSSACNKVALHQLADLRRPHNDNAGQRKYLMYGIKHILYYSVQQCWMKTKWMKSLRNSSES